MYGVVGMTQQHIYTTHMCVSLLMYSVCRLDILSIIDSRCFMRMTRYVRVDFVYTNIFWRMLSPEAYIYSRCYYSPHIVVANKHISRVYRVCVCGDKRCPRQTVESQIVHSHADLWCFTILIVDASAELVLYK